MSDLNPHTDFMVSYLGEMSKGWRGQALSLPRLDLNPTTNSLLLSFPCYLDNLLEQIVRYIKPNFLPQGFHIA